MINKRNIGKMSEQAYNKVYKEYLNLEGEIKWPRLKWLKKILNQIEPGSTVLDIGCGSGKPVDIEIEKNHKVFGVDISKEMIKIAKNNVPNGEFIHKDFRDLEFSNNSFDAIVAFYVIELIPRKEHEAVLYKFMKWLKPKGFLLFTLEANEYIDETGEWLGETIFISSYDSETMKKIVNKVGFKILETTIETQIEGKTEIPYLRILAQK